MQVGGHCLLCRDDIVRDDTSSGLTGGIDRVPDRSPSCSSFSTRLPTKPHSGSRASASEGIERPLVLAVPSVITPRASQHLRL